jgi:hypothetical protein
MRGAALVLGVLVLLSGCADRAETPLSVAGLSEDQGAIEGAVVDEEILGIPGVNVTVIGTSIQTTTDDNGSFAIGGLEPILHRLRFEALGYHAKEMEVQVFAGDANRVSIVLLAKPSDFPYAEVVIKRGFWYCGIQYVAAGFYCAVNVAGAPTLNVVLFNVTLAEGWNETVVEHVWDRNSGITTSGRGYGYIRTLNVTDQKTYELKETIRGESPLYARVYPGYVGHQSYQTQVLGRDFRIAEGVRGLSYAGYPWGLLGPELAAVYPEQPGAPNQGVGATLQTPFDLFLAQFYHRASPADYSSIPDR